jgi:hypothetical protein
MSGKDYLTEDNNNWSACAPDTQKYIEKIAEHLAFGDDAIIRHTKN